MAPPRVAPGRPRSHAGMAALCAPHHNPGGEAMPTKTLEKKVSGGKANALQKPLQPSEELAAVVGSGPLPRGQVVSKMWDYIRSNESGIENSRMFIGAPPAFRSSGRRWPGTHSYPFAPPSTGGKSS